jgi:hypothetical protein
MYDECMHTFDFLKIPHGKIGEQSGNAVMYEYLLITDK